MNIVNEMKSEMSNDLPTTGHIKVSAQLALEPLTLQYRSASIWPHTQNEFYVQKDRLIFSRFYMRSRSNPKAFSHYL